MWMVVMWMTTPLLFTSLYFIFWGMAIFSSLFFMLKMRAEFFFSFFFLAHLCELYFLSFFCIAMPNFDISREVINVRSVFILVDGMACC
jgi:hypothetical protein